METALHSFFASVPQAVALWMLMLLGIAVATTALGVPRKPMPVPEAEVDADALRYAGEVAAAADRAAAAAAHHRAAWEAAQDELDAAWAAFDTADRAARRAAAACAYPLMSRRRKPGENAERERYLHRTAAAACRERKISIAQLNEIYAHRGWNPRLHPVVQEAALRAAVREHRFAGYRTAMECERAAWREAERAAEALRGLRAEAAAAYAGAGGEQPVSDEQWWAGQWTTAELPAAA